MRSSVSGFLKYPVFWKAGVAPTTAQSTPATVTAEVASDPGA